MSLTAHKFFKIFLKTLCAVVVAISAYLLYAALTLPPTYPILNFVLVALLVLLLIFGVVALIT